MGDYLNFVTQDRLNLIKETAKYGNFGHIDLEDSECGCALYFLLHIDDTPGWQERLYLNYHYICKHAKVDDLKSMHYTAKEGKHFLNKLVTMLTQYPFTRLDDQANIFPNERILQKEMMALLFGRIKDRPNLLQVGNGIQNIFLLFPDVCFVQYDQAILHHGIQFDVFHLVSMYNKNNIASMCQRFHYLKSNAPAYLNYMIHKIDLPINKNLFNLTDYILLLENGFFQDNIDIKNYIPCAWNIYTMSNRYIMGYYLGFDPRNGMVPLPCIKTALLELSNLGIEAYINKVLSRAPCHPHEAKCADCTSDVDLMLTKISEYSLFDIIYFYEGNKMWIITRPLFEDLLIKEINPYTRRQLPLTVLMEITARRKIAELQQLPSSGSLIEILTRLNDPYYQVEEDPI